MFRKVNSICGATLNCFLHPDSFRLHRSSEYATAKEQFDSRLQRQSAALAKLKPEVLIAKLAKTSREADDQAEILYDEYIAGSLTVENFISAYSKKKTVAHARNLKSTAATQTLS